MKHTQGPWKINGRYIEDENKNCICDPFDHALERDEQEANAKLIAVAPELLKLLEDMLASGIVDEESAPCFTAETKRLIAKAKGGAE